MGDEAPWSRVKAELFSFVGRNPRSNKRLVRHAAIGPSDRIVDIGCGPGAAVRRAARLAVGGEVVGVDASAPMIHIAERRSRGIGNVSFVVGEAEELPSESERFTHAWTIHSFHHWSDERAGLEEMWRVLAPGGTAFVVESHGRGAHAMSDAKATEVAETMDEIGFHATKVERVFREIVVSGSKAV